MTATPISFKLDSIRGPVGFVALGISFSKESTDRKPPFTYSFRDIEFKLPEATSQKLAGNYIDFAWDSFASLRIYNERQDDLELWVKALEQTIPLLLKRRPGIWQMSSQSYFCHLWDRRFSEKYPDFSRSYYLKKISFKEILIKMYYKKITVLLVLQSHKL